MPAALLLGLALVWFAIRCVHGIHFVTFGDESGHLLGARAIRAGDRLYRDYIDAHGPLSFMVAQGAGWLFGWKEPLESRWAICLATLLTAMCVGASPALRGATSRLWAAALFLGLVSAPWLVQALNQVNYHVLGGLACAVVLAWLVVPAWLGVPVARWQAAGAGVGMAMMGAAAYALAPSALLLAASAAAFLWAAAPGIRPTRVLAATGLGFLAGVLAVAVWMARYGDFVGYLTFHVIANQVYYAPYIGFGLATMLRSFVLSAGPAQLVQSGAVVACVTGFLMLGVCGMSASLRRPVLLLLGVALCFAALALLNSRGAEGFQDGAFLVASLALLALAVPVALQRAGIRGAGWLWAATAAMLAVLAGSELVDRNAVGSPFGAMRAQFVRWPPSILKVDRSSPVYLRVAEVLRPGERLLAIPYMPDFYLLAGFLPIRKFHAYLPWEADYARTPWFGRTRDLCEELQIRPPPVIAYDKWVVWDRYAPESYIPCLKQVLSRDYVADAIPLLYVRRDRVAEVKK